MGEGQSKTQQGNMVSKLNPDAYRTDTHVAGDFSRTENSPFSEDQFISDERIVGMK